jgi:uncharacterized protein (TIGR00661 family)
LGAKKILIAPLDWGLGHATRCIPVIRELLNAGHEVIVAGDGNGQHILGEEFPSLKFIYLKGYHLTYSENVPAWLKIFIQLPKIFFRVCSEHAAMKKIIRDHAIDAVISDNRFGLWNKNIFSVYITHQLMIKCPRGFKIFEPLLHFLHSRIIRKYDQCWIPDFEGEKNLSGDLSHKSSLPSNARFINPLSRFADKNTDGHFEYDLCIIISGPEPERSSFEKIMLAQLEGYSGKAILVLGKPQEKRNEIAYHTTIVSHLSSSELERTIAASRMIICRSGYSSIMDLTALQKDALLIPTPGQTEQEYLAGYLSAKKIFATQTQSAFRLEDVITEKSISVTKAVQEKDEYSPLKKAIKELNDIQKSSPVYKLNYSGEEHGHR